MIRWMDETLKWIWRLLSMSWEVWRILYAPEKVWYTIIELSKTLQHGTYQRRCFITEIVMMFERSTSPNLAQYNLPRVFMANVFACFGTLGIPS